MLELRGITKDYVAGAGTVSALKGIDLKFRSNEFVSVLGPSGCGKTTMLNIVGGLDQYTSGDLLINGISTKQFKNRDWDAYRNHSVGFVFQTYNLIPHQSVLNNVELALTISGVSKAERRVRAIAALEAVGLGDQLRKKPNEMSGGQMQRVAIARALVNNPDIVLADEPTGALDTETSVQVMDILKEVAKERLVVMVTHNPELAEKYSSRIIRMLDGKIIGDSKPFTEEEYEQEKELDTQRVIEENKKKKPTMSFWTAFKLSLKNLFTKKGRTTLTSFAGSIGIIGIALILAVSQGMTGYINHVQETTLASYPLTIESSNIDLMSLMESFMNVGKDSPKHDNDAIYQDPVVGELVNALANVQTSENDLKAFKTHLEEQVTIEGSNLQKSLIGMQYSYDMDLTVYTENEQDGEIIKSDTAELLTEVIGDYFMAISSQGGAGASGSTGASGGSSGSSSMFSNMMMSSGMWQELLPGLNEGEYVNKMIKDQYELIDGGSWPNEKDEIVLIVNEKNELNDLTLYALGLISKAEIDAIVDAAANGETLERVDRSWSYEEIKQRTFKTILPADCYMPVGGIWVDMSNNQEFLRVLYNGDKTLELKVTGIIRPKKDADATMLDGGIGYTSALTEYIIEKAKNSDVVQAQVNSPNVDVLTGKPFRAADGALTDEQKALAFRAYVNDLPTAGKAQAYIGIKSIMPADQLLQKTMEAMAAYPDRASQQALVVNAMAAQMGMEAAALATYFDGLTDDQIKGMAFAICQAGVQTAYAKQTEASFVGTPDADLAALLDGEIDGYTTQQCATYYDQVTDFSESTYESNLAMLGCLDVDSPSAISLYASSFENKDLIVKAIDEYNKSVGEAQKISYTDYMGLMMSSVTKIIDAVKYVLIAFVSISLVVSSIMIGVITLISVQERTKEIGILRAIGASKRDVSSMFNAETLIIGFAAGLLGVLVTYLLCIPINIILNALTGIAALKAVLPFGAAVILVLISMGLTLISGLIPSRSAAKKDPVVALRTE